MSLPKKFLHRQFPDVSLNRTKFVIGLAIGIGYAFSFYSFLFGMREFFRVFSLFNNDFCFWILPEEERHFSNLFFAMIAVILGQSQAILYWIDKPRRPWEMRNRMNRTIVNDQRVLNWSFLHFFGKVGVQFGILTGMIFSSNLLGIKLYPDYRWAFWLCALVLFLQTWSTIRACWGNRSWKWMGLTAMILLLIAFGFSRINVVNYESINMHYQRHNPFYVYAIELPESQYTHRLYDRSYSSVIFLVDDPNHIKEVLRVDRNANTIPDLSSWYLSIAQLRIERPHDPLLIQLFIDKDISMLHVNKLKQELNPLGYHKYVHILAEPGLSSNSACSNERSIISRNSIYNLPVPPPFTYQEVLSMVRKESGYLKLTNDTTGNALICNNQSVPIDHFRGFLMDWIVKYPEYAIEYQVHNDFSYAHYIKTLELVHLAVDDLRREYIRKEYGLNDKFPDYWVREEAELMFPVRIIELYSN